MNKKVGYAGWIGHNNIGDEALLEANRRLFDGVDFIDARYWDGYDSLLFGGGTILPQFLLGGDPKIIRGNQCTAAIGVGVRSPTFWNRQISSVDLRYFAGKAGVPTLIRNKYVEYILKPIEHLSPSAITTGYYFSDDDYHAIGEYDFDYLGVRGPLSEKILSNYGINCEKIGDTALALEPSSTEIDREEKITVCLQHNKLKWANNEEYLHYIVDFLRKIQSQYKIVFLPFQKEDLSLHIELSDKLDNAECKNYCSPMDVQGVIDEIASSKLMIGEKLHANILSACSYTPFISLEYRPKCLDFAASIGMDDYNIRIDQLTENKLKTTFNNIAGHNEVVNQLESEVNEKRQHLRQFAQKIATNI